MSVGNCKACCHFKISHSIKFHFILCKLDKLISLTYDEIKENWQDPKILDPISLPNRNKIYSCLWAASTTKSWQIKWITIRYFLWLRTSSFGTTRSVPPWDSMMPVLDLPLDWAKVGLIGVECEKKSTLKRLLFQIKRFKQNINIWFLMMRPTCTHKYLWKYGGCVRNWTLEYE